jgi:transcriptional regulator with XRE-family HTH domain
MKKIKIKTFGDYIQEIRISKNKTLRNISQELLSISLTKYSKIERSIQQPKDINEFNEIIKALKINDAILIKKLKKLSKEKLPSKIPTDEEIREEYPAFVPPHIKTKEELNEFLNNYRKIIIESYTPEI